LLHNGFNHLKLNNSPLTKGGDFPRKSRGLGVMGFVVSSWGIEKEGK
jgi:hypothetical protein